MRQFIDITETYTDSLLHFRNYMRDEEFDYYRNWFWVCQWCEENDLLEEISELTGEEITDAEEMHELEPDLFKKLSPEIQKECSDWVQDYLIQHDPGEADTRQHMSLAAPKPLHRQTWLVHFSDHAFDIALNGFKYGVDQMDKLGLTTYLSAGDKSLGGYNFAFEALSRDAEYAQGQGKYGRHAVLFQNSGIKCYHYGDNETQIVFDGREVSPRQLIYLEKDDGEWKVKSKWRDQKRGHLFQGTYRNAVKWVMSHHAQYRKLLY